MHDEYTAVESILIHIDDQSLNCLQDNILYYIGGFIVCTLLQELECAKCKKELLLDPDNPAARNMISFQCLQSLHNASNMEVLYYHLLQS